MGGSSTHTALHHAFICTILKYQLHTVCNVLCIRNCVDALDVGALFSGADIVQWMMESLAGLETSEEAEKLGQLLLDQGAILHSEGSR